MAKKAVESRSLTRILDESGKHSLLPIDSTASFCCLDHPGWPGISHPDRMHVKRRHIRRINLAREILRIAHQSGWKRGHHLTEPLLCRELGVSRSPVRSALSLLREWKSVSHRPNQGHFLTRDSEELLSRGKEAPFSVEDELMLHFIRERLGGKLPDMFTQEEIENTFGKPRSTVESALSKMAAEGLIEKCNGQGWQFLPTLESTASREHSYRFRSVIEPAAILLPQFKVDHAALVFCRLAHSDLLTGTKAGNVAPGWTYRIDAEFHELLASFSGNVFFLQAVQHQNRLRRILEYHGSANRRRVAEWVGEHLAIIEALECGRMEQASERMLLHLRKAYMSITSIDGTT